MKAILMCVALTFSLLATPGIAATVYTQDFESGALGTEWSGAGSAQSSQGLSAFGFGDWHLKNDGASASVLTLGALGSHTSLMVTFDLAMWDSIDFGGDLFQVQVDGSFVVNETFGNYFPASGSEGPGTPITPPTNGAFADPQYGYNTSFRDSARAISVTVPHVASDAVISFQFPNTQTAPDEAFGIDNVIVEIIPEPSSQFLLGSLYAITGIMRRRR